MEYPPHICLDFDGTVVEQRDGYYNAIIQKFTERGLAYPSREVFDKALWIDDFSPMYEYCNDQGLWFEITDLYCARIDDLVVFDGARKFLKRMSKVEVTLTCATGRTATRQQFTSILNELDVAKYFAEYISYGETDHVKVVQAGDVDKSFMFNSLANKIGVDINDSWYVTDIATDADKALDVGFARVFGVTTGGINPKLFNSEVTVLESLSDL